MIQKLFRLFYTLKYLKLTQLFFFVIRRLLPLPTINYTGNPTVRAAFFLEAANPTHNLGRGDRRFHFLNEEKYFSGAVDWAPTDVSRLWRYNLHYFDYLREPSRTAIEKFQLMGEWIKSNPQSSEPGWEPFTISLRVVNWIFYLSLTPEYQNQTILRSLYLQTLWLEKNDERHILANHYFENLKALMFAGTFFEGDDAARWRHKAIKGLTEQLKEQTLNDGGHYERTPQYHALMLENYLDLYNLAVNNNEVIPVELKDQLNKTILHGLEFLSDIVFPDFKIPLFNDSAFNIPPALAELVEYATRLQLITSAQANSFTDISIQKLIEKPASGIYGCRVNNDMFVIDSGDIGPAYQPGHTHCDLLSYELMLGGARVVVDTGVSQYEPGPMRGHVRSTAAHNTISVDGLDQSEVWGEFRVARRAKVLAASISRKGSGVHFEGAYTGFHRAKGRIEHRRTVDIDLFAEADSGEGKAFRHLTIRDTVEGSGVHLVENAIHLHPDLEVVDEGVGTVLISHKGIPLARLSIHGAGYALAPASYCPEFGKILKNTKIVIIKESLLPLQMSYTITKLT